MNPIEDFLSLHGKRTQRIYRWRLTDYFQTLGIDPEDTRQIERYLKSKRNYDEDIKKYIKKIEHLKPLTKKCNITTVRTFLDDNNIELSKKMKRQIKAMIKQSRPATQDTVSTPQELKEILQHAGAKERALFLTLSSSGMRIDESLQITMKDVPSIQDCRQGRPVKFPVKIYLRAGYTKTKQARIVFISREAWDSIISWLKERDTWLEQAHRKSGGRKKRYDDRIFPWSYLNSFKMWTRLLKKSGYDELDGETGRYRRHIHTLRKYFRIYSAPKAGNDVVELILGHQDTLGNVYRDRYPESKLEEQYLLAEPDISVFSVPPDLSEINKNMEQLRHENQELKENQRLMELTLQSIRNELENKKNALEIEKIKNGKK